MKYGVVFPQTEMGADVGAVRAYAQTVEELGYDYLLVYDHVLGANPERPGGWQGPYTYTDSFHEPFVVFGYWAAITTKIELTASVIILPQRQTALVAKQAAEVDVLSNGRLRLGIGVGWNQVEYEALNEDFHNRGKRYDEQIELLNALWTEPLVTFHGKYHTVSDAGLNPMPVQRPIPLWFGGRADVALRRMAKYGAGWMASSSTPESAEPMLEQIHEYLIEAGRTPESFGLDLWLSVKREGPDEWPALLQRWHTLGATHIAINTMGAGYTTVDQHLETVRQFREATAA